MKYLSNL